jgi:exonuclease VII small subunit
MSTAKPTKPTLQNQLDLDNALEKFDDGIKLTEAIKRRLATFENKVTLLKKRFDQESA